MKYVIICLVCVSVWRGDGGTRGLHPVARVSSWLRQREGVPLEYHRTPRQENSAGHHRPGHASRILHFRTQEIPWLQFLHIGKLYDLEPGSPGIHHDRESGQRFCLIIYILTFLLIRCFFSSALIPFL